jgi:hypothetical protein
MKIEIAENLVYSYLKHVEGCRIVQTNWKTSGNWKTTDYDEKQAKELYNKVKNTPSFQGIFKNSDFEQLIKQAEIDVLGLNTTEQSIFGIDVAFHNAGLNYGSSTETAMITMKKIFRTIFIMQSYFSNFDKFNSYFVTPKVNPATEKPILKLLDEARKIISDEMISINFISNDDFFRTIVDPATNCINDENDTAELFSRTFKLLQLDSRNSQNTKGTPFLSDNAISKTYPVSATIKRTEEGMKIGQFVQLKMRKLFEQGLISQDEVALLQDKEYSKEIFNQNYEILRSPDKEIISNDGRSRYYTKERFCGNYYLTSQWLDYHWEPFWNWVKQLEDK